MTLALLLTAVTGAWADETLVTIDASDYDMISTATSFSKEKDGITIAFSSAKKLASYFELQSSTTVTITSTVGKIKSVVFSCPAMGTAKYGPGCLGSPTAGQYSYIDMTGTWTGEAESFTLTSSDKVRFDLIYVTVGEPDATEAPIKVTTNAASAQDLFTEAKFNMPAFDATVNYELVRDMQDETNPVAFSGLPSSGNIVVKKGDDGKYQPAEALTIQLIDPLAAAEAQNIIAADGITVKVLVGAENELGAIDYDLVSPITLDAFLADMKPGYYWIKAEPTDENSPYDGTVYSSQFTVVEKYDLTVKPANDFSKGKIDAVTVGTESVIIDATTGEATKTGIAPGTEVKLKAKKGYVIEKVEAKKIVPAEGHDLTASAVGDIVGSDGKTYAAADKDNLPKNVTAVAMVAYKNGTGGLAIALSDEGSMNFSTAKSTCASKTAISGATWQLPSKNQWEQIFSANGGNNNSYTGLNTAIDNAGGTALVAGNVYWSTSSAPVSGSYYCMIINNDGSIGSQIGSSGKNKMTRAILTF